VVLTRRGEQYYARQVVFNLPLDLSTRLLGRTLKGRLRRLEAKSRAVWSAFTAYLAIDRSAVGEQSPFFHQVLQSYDQPIHDGNNVLISLSPPDDEGYGPQGVRVATLSTHTRPADWFDLSRTEYQRKKEDYQDRILSALTRALPDAPGSLVHAEFASPRSFRRYTRRTAGAVGGAPVSRFNSNFLAVSSNALGHGLWTVGDTVFPGQGTMATVISAIRVVERLTGTTWAEIRRANGPDHDRAGLAGSACLQPQP
jgi:phytoene dehydrogenase-like protein